MCHFSIGLHYRAHGPLHRMSLLKIAVETLPHPSPVRKIISDFDLSDDLRMSPWWSLCTLHSSLFRWSYRRRLDGSLLLWACVQFNVICDVHLLFERNYCIVLY